MLTADQAAGSPGHGFSRAAVIGAGLMGRGIAAVLASGGLDVMLCDVQPDRLDESVAAVRSHAAARGAGKADAGPEVGGSADLAQAVRGTDLVVEAVVEDPHPLSARRWAPPSPARVRGVITPDKTADPP